MPQKAFFFSDERQFQVFRLNAYVFLSIKFIE